MGRALGARVGKSEGGWEVGVTSVGLTERGRQIFGKSALVSISFGALTLIPAFSHGVECMLNRHDSLYIKFTAM